MVPSEREQGTQDFIEQHIEEVVNIMCPVLPGDITWRDLISVFEELKQTVTSRVQYSIMISNCIMMLSDMRTDMLSPRDKESFNAFSTYVAWEYNNLEEESEMSEYEPVDEDMEEVQGPSINRD